MLWNVRDVLKIVALRAESCLTIRKQFEQYSICICIQFAGITNPLLFDSVVKVTVSKPLIHNYLPYKKRKRYECLIQEVGKTIAKLHFH